MIPSSIIRNELTDQESITIDKKEKANKNVSKSSISERSKSGTSKKQSKVERTQISLSKEQTMVNDLCLLADAYLIPIEEDYARESLLARFNVREFPTLVLIDQGANVISTDAITDIKKFTKPQLIKEWNDSYKKFNK